MCLVFSAAVMGTSREWYTQLDCDDEITTSSSTSCGEHAGKPCCHLQGVLSNMQEGDTVYLKQKFPAKNSSKCSDRKHVPIEVRKSFTLKIAKPTGMVDNDLVEGIHGISMVINNNCSESCTVTIDQSRFSCSSLTSNNLNIWIKDSIFTSGFITARSLPEVDSNSYNIKIQDTEFHSSALMKNKQDTGLIKSGPYQQLNFIYINGYWDSVNIIASVMEGVREGIISGVEVVHANVRTLNLIGVHLSFLFSALVVRSSSAVDIFNVADSIFLGNRDGIDIGQGVRHMVLSRSAMNNTASWNVDEEDLNYLSPGGVLDLKSRTAFDQCNSALKGSPKSLKVEHSVFAHNHASGINCKGSALYLTSNDYRISPLLSNNETYESQNPLIMTIEFVKSVFYDNMAENCFVEKSGGGGENSSGGGGAVTVYGLQLLMKIIDSTFVRNQACKGAGLYIGMSDWWPTGLSQNGSAGWVLSLGIIIDTCEFNENVAEYGGGLMTEITESMLDTGSSLSILINNSSFYRNKAHYGGAGVYLHYFNVSVNSGVSVMINISNTDSKENSIGGRGGGMNIKFVSLSLMSHASIRTVVNNCSFTSNTAHDGAGIFTGMYSSSLHPHSSFIFETCHSAFTSNVATYGAGISTDMDSCSLHSYSFFIFETSDSIFISNTAELGAGILTYMKSCSLNSNSSLTLQTSDSTFTFNTAEYYGAGIHTYMESCSLYSNSYLTLQMADSTFTSNTAGQWGAGIITRMYSSSLHPYSSFIFEACHSTFTSNTAVWGAGVNTFMMSCSLYSNSYLTLQISHSTFTSNTAQRGAGIYTGMFSCSLYSNLSLRLQTSNSTFTSNTAQQGAGIYTYMKSCSLNSNSSLTLQTSDSTFTFNTAEYYGAGIHTYMDSCYLYSNSSLTLQMSHSIFTSNSAELGAGIFTQMESCSLYSNSSLTLQTYGSIFTFNTAELGTGINTFMMSCSLYSNSSLTLQISHSTFTSNTAEYGGGAGISTFMGSCSLYSKSSITFQISNSIFTSNKADKGASICVQHFDKSICVSGEIVVAINDCRFLNNSARREGGSLFFQVVPVAKLYVKQSVFETNRAHGGSGLYRENIEMIPTCNNTSSYDIKTQALITTHIIQCLFIKNIDTAILVNSKQKYGTLAVTKCLFKNNRCMKSLFAEDVFTDIDLELTHTKILRDKNNPRTISINSQSDAKLDNVTVSTLGIPNQRQIRIATFSHFSTQANGSSLKYQCPAFYQPALSHAGLTYVGAVVLKVTCDACFEGYYIGESQIAISNENEGNNHCYEKDIINEYNSVMGKNKLCYTKTVGTCIECPHGANCSGGVVTLPNYWGHMTSADRLEFHRCPVGYCCNQAPCQGIAQCAAHREGTLCGHCIKGFTESLITPECIQDKTCRDWWIFPLFCLWIFVVTLVIVFSQDILQIKDTILMHMKRNRSKGGKKNKTLSQVELGETKHQSQCDTKVQSLQASCIRFISNNMQGRGMQTSQVKLPILWGALTMMREQNVEASGSHKYLQIMLYYLQDAALIQIDLALAAVVVSPIQKLRQLLLNVSQLAVELIDLGLNLCPFPGWTPVSKLLTKNLTGPFVFLYIFVIYGIVRMACWCCESKGKSLRTYWYPRLTAAAIFSLLLFYQQIANVAFSLLYCINSGGQSILFIDGTVTCYQPWQILCFIFAFNWVIGIIPVLMFLPGLLELQMISVPHFFLACLMPLPMLFYWMFRFYRHKLKFLTMHDVTPWHEEAMKILQKTFVKTIDKKGLPVCWIGFMKVRRLALVLLFTFVSNLVARVSLMCFVIVLFLVIHLKTEPYQDDLANKLYTASLLATLAIGILNIMKASCVEFYLDLNKVAHFLTTLNIITDSILVYCPLGFIGFTIAVILIGQLKGFVQKKRKKQN